MLLHKQDDILVLYVEVLANPKVENLVDKRGIINMKKRVYSYLEITENVSIFSMQQRKRDVILYMGESHAKPYRAAGAPADDARRRFAKARMCNRCSTTVQRRSKRRTECNAMPRR